MSTITLSERDAERAGLVKKRHKYRAKPCIIGTLRFSSQKEGKRYLELKLLQDAREISDLITQVRFALTTLDPKRQEAKVGEYVADFAYRRDGQYVIEDTKGFRTPLYRWKKKHFEAQYGIKITEI